MRCSKNAEARALFDCSLVDQHDWNVVFHPIDAAARCALKTFGLLPIFERHFANRADQNFQQLFCNHNPHCTTVTNERGAGCCKVQIPGQA